MASVGFGTVAPAVASPAARTTSLGGRRARPSTTAHVPAATKVVVSAAKQEKGLFDSIFGALYKEDQLLETDPILNKVQGKAAAPTPKKAAAAAAAAPEESGLGGFGGLGGFFSKPKTKKG